MAGRLSTNGGASAQAVDGDVWRDLGRAAGAGNGQPAVLDAILKTAFQLFPDAASGALFLYQSEQLRLQLAPWVDGRAGGPAVGPAAAELAAAVALHGEPQFAPELSTSPAADTGQPARTFSLMALPLKSAAHLVGVLNLTFPAGRAFGEGDKAAIERLNEQAAMAIDSAWQFEITRRQVQELTVLHRVAVAAAEAGSEDDLIARATQIIGAELFPDNFGIMLFDAAAGVLRFHPTYQGVDLATLAEVVPVSVGITGTVAIQGLPVRVGDVRGDPRFFDLCPATLSELCVPLKVGVRVIGVVNAESARREAFSATDERLVLTMAGQVAIAINRLRVAAAERRTAQQAAESQAVLYEASQAINASLDPEQVYAATHRAAARLMPCDAFTLALLDDLEQRIELVYAVDQGRRLPAEWAGPRSGLTGLVLTTGQPVRVDRLEQLGELRPLHFGGPDRVQSLVAVPMRLRGKVFGMLSAQAYAPAAYAAADEQVLNLLANQAAVAIVNARLYAQARANARELGQLFAASQEMGASHDPHAVLAALAKHLTDGLDASSAYIIEADLGQSTIAVQAEYWGATASVTERVVTRDKLHLADFPHAERSAREQAVVQFRLAEASLSAAEQVFLTRYGVQSELIVPVLARGQTLGLAVVWDRQRPRVFAPSEIGLAQMLARQAASVMENARLFGALEDETRRLELLYSLSQSLTASLNLSEVAERALELVRAAFGADDGAIFVPEENSTQLVRLSVGRAPGIHEADDSAVAPVMAEMAARAAASREMVSTGTASPLPAELPLSGQSQSVRSVVAVPLQIGASLVAVCVLARQNPGVTTAPPLSMLSAAGAPMALALQNARLFDAEARRAHHLEALNEISRAAVSALDFPSLLQTLAARLGDLLAADVCYLTLWDETRRLPIPAAASRPRVEISPLVLPADGSISATEAVLRAGKALIAEDIRAAPHLIDPGQAALLSARSVIALPLITGSRRLGAAIVEFHQPHHFTAQEIARCEQAARQIALAIARAELFEETRRRADEVTSATDVLRALNALPDVVEAFPAILRGLRAISHCERVRISVLDPTTGLFTVVADDAPTAPSGDPPYRIDELAAAVDVLAGREHLAANLGAELDYPVEAGLFDAGLRSSVTLPLRATNQVLGALRLGWSQVSGYRTVNIASLAQIADAIALALEKNRLFVETRRRADELATLVSVSTALRAARSSADMLPIFLQQACQVTGAIVSTIFMLDGDTGELVMRGSFPPDPGLIGLRQHPNEGIAGYVAQSGRIYVSRDLRTDTLVRLAEPVEATYLRAVRSSLTVPLRTDEGVVGVLHVGRERPHDFTAEEIHLLTAIAEIAGSALQRANLLETLEQRVAERTRMLADANVRLKELDRLKDQFISNVSHELRTPLTNIKLHLSLLERRGTDALGRYLPTIQRETERLRRLIEDLLDLSRLQAQIAVPRRQVQRLDPLLAEVIALHATRAEARGLSLVHRPAANPIDAAVDRAQMLQVFTNLIGNAIAYTPQDGGVQIDSRAEAYLGQAGVQINFQNWPAVIPASDLPHLFDRFFRGATAFESGEAGTGLGLAISKEIVELHGGRIWVESAENSVTTVRIWLPLTE